MIGPYVVWSVMHYLEPAGTSVLIDIGVTYLPILQQVVFYLLCSRFFFFISPLPPHLVNWTLHTRQTSRIVGHL